MSTMVLPFLVSTYAMNIYQFGTNRLTARDGYSGVLTGYYTPVEQYAGEKFAKSIIDNALVQGWINEQEYNETIAFVPVSSSTSDNTIQQ